MTAAIFTKRFKAVTATTFLLVTSKTRFAPQLVQTLEPGFVAVKQKGQSSPGFTSSFDIAKSPLGIDEMKLSMVINKIT